MKRDKQMRLFDFDGSPANADSADQQGRGPSPETVPSTDVPLDQCTGPLFCPRCGMPYDWESAGEFCMCGARRCLTCGDS